MLFKIEELFRNVIIFMFLNIIYGCQRIYHIIILFHKFSEMD